MTRNISISSITGGIFGRHVLDGHNNVRTASGNTLMFLAPRYEGKYEPRSVSVTSDTGEMDIRTEFEHWPYQPPHHTIHLHSKTGKIWSVLPQGSLTNISSLSGEVKSAIVPFGATDDFTGTEFYTHLESGFCLVWIMDGPSESMKGRWNPLLNMVSTHTVGQGTLKLRSGYSWYGDMEGRVDNGSIEFDSSTLDEFERGYGYVKAKRVRGTSGRSRMQAEVGIGDIEIKLGL